MIATLAAMTVPLIVLLIAGFTILGLGWWLAVVSEGKDEWLTGDDPKHNHETCGECNHQRTQARIEGRNQEAADSLARHLERPYE